MYSQTFVRILVLVGFLSLGIHAQSIEKTIKIQPPKPGESHYSYLPFDVPPNTESLSFSFEYDKSDGANTLDFGIFDSEFSGQNIDKNGFRGWSGSVRDSVFIAREKATHGYAAGEIQPGKWYLIVGLAKIAPQGVSLKLTVKFNQIDEKPLKQFEAEASKEFSFERGEKHPPIKTKVLTWFSGDLHSHTFHGDGTWSVKAILESARSNGLDFVAITEHNTFTHHKDIDAEAKNYPKMLILKGQEVTTYGGHIGIWGLPSGKWVDFRVLPDIGSSAGKIADEAHQLHALASINHPTMGCNGCGWSNGSNWENFDSVEIWNATWNDDDESALTLWDGSLQRGLRITAVGSSDSHQPPYEPSKYPTNLTIGDPTVFIGAKTLSKEDLFEGIRNGRVFVAESPRYSVRFTADKVWTVGDKINVSKNEKVNLNFALKGFPVQSKILLISGGKVIEELETSSKNFSKNFAFTVATDTYVRIEIRKNDHKMLAFSNPIYFQIK